MLLPIALFKLWNFYAFHVAYIVPGVGIAKLLGYLFWSPPEEPEISQAQLSFELVGLLSFLIGLFYLYPRSDPRISSLRRKQGAFLITWLVIFQSLFAFTQWQHPPTCALSARLWNFTSWFKCPKAEQPYIWLITLIEFIVELYQRSVLGILSPIFMILFGRGIFSLVSLLNFLLCWALVYAFFGVNLFQQLAAVVPGLMQNAIMPAGAALFRLLR